MEQERISAYLHSLSSGQEEYLDLVREQAQKDKIPVIRVEMESFLAVFLNLKKPRRILEAGAAVGYSAMVMARQTAEFGCRIDTIEKDPDRITAFERNVSRSPWKDRIRLICGDVLEIFGRLSEQGGKYDLIFMDAAKGQYIHYLPYALELLEKGGILISDNVLQDMTVLDSRFALERRERTIHRRMRDYLYVLKHTEGLLTTIVPIGDGAAVTVKMADQILPESLQRAAGGKTYA